MRHPADAWTLRWEADFTEGHRAFLLAAGLSCQRAALAGRLGIAARPLHRLATCRWVPSEALAKLLAPTLGIPVEAWGRVERA